MSSLDEKLKAYENRLEKRKPLRVEEERIREEKRQEALRLAYLQRTGRKEMKP